MGRFSKVSAAVVGMAVLAVAVSPAGSAPIVVAAPSGSQWTYTTTCATNSMSATIDLHNANQFAGAFVTDDEGGFATSSAGHFGGGRIIDGAGNPTTASNDNWIISTTHQSFTATAYELIERVGAGTGTETKVAGPISTSGCTAYDALPAGSFTPLPPTRVLDTRPASLKNYSGPKPAAGTTVPLAIAGLSGVPANALAVALNVTATETASAGFVQVFPTGRTTAGSSSSLNAEIANQTIPNAVIVQVGDGGSISFYTQNGGHVVADVAGYFVEATTAVSAGRFAAVAPTRVLDTRPASAVNYTGPKPAAGTIVTAHVTDAAGLPAGPRVSAVALNVTATESNGPGFVQAAPTGSLVAGVSSNLNTVKAGQTIANLVIVPVNNGNVDLYTQTGTHLVVDVLGWFSAATEPPTDQGLFVPIPTERVLDSRPTSGINFDSNVHNGVETGKPTSAENVSVYLDGITSSIGAVVLNLTATEADGPGFVQAAAATELVPGASSNLNVERVGETIANAAIVPASVTGGVDIYTKGSTHLIGDLAGIFTG